MSQRGAGQTGRKLSLMPCSALGRPIVQLVRRMLRGGLRPAEVCSLMAHAASSLGKCRGGLTRSEWLELCERLWDGGGDGESGHDERRLVTLTAPGGDA